MTSHDQCQSPTTGYVIPRGRCVCRVEITNRDELRLLRTELELLRRINNGVRFGKLKRPAEGLRTLEPEDYLDLDQILHDAAHPVVGVMIARIDQEFADLRKDIVMTVVDEAAKDIVTEAAEAGITPAPAEAPTPNTDEAKATPASDTDIVQPPAMTPKETEAMSATEALDAAQAGLAEALVDAPKVENESAETPSAPQDSETPPEDATASDTTEQDAKTEPACTDESPADTTIESENTESTAGAEEAACDETPADAPTASETDTTPADTVAEPEPVAQATEEPPAAAPVPPDISTKSSMPTEIDCEHLENAVAVIEQGIRKLATMLKTELKDQWTRAHETLDSIDTGREKLDLQSRETQDILKEITRLREETQIARDEADIARREAKLQRDDARIAKERAETSASAAELAADQASREARTVHGLSTNRAGD